MKKSLLAFTAGVLLLACNQTKDTSTTGNDSGSNKEDHAAVTKRNGETMRNIYRAIESGDVSKMDNYITSDAIDHEGNMGRDIVGLDSVKHMLGSIHNFMEGVKMEVMSEATSTDGMYHFSTVRMTGKAKENPWGMPVGMNIDDTGIDLVKMRDGKVAEHWSFTSQKDMMEMMSAMHGSDMAKKTDMSKDMNKNMKDTMRR